MSAIGTGFFECVKNVHAALHRTALQAYSHPPTHTRTRTREDERAAREKVGCGIGEQVAADTVDDDVIVLLKHGALPLIAKSPLSNPSLFPHSQNECSMCYRHNFVRPDAIHEARRSCASLVC